MIVGREDEDISGLIYYRPQDDDNADRKKWSSFAVADLMTYSERNGLILTNQDISKFLLGARAMYDVMIAKLGEKGQARD